MEEIFPERTERTKRKKEQKLKREAQKSSKKLIPESSQDWTFTKGHTKFLTLPMGKNGSRSRNTLLVSQNTGGKRKDPVRFQKEETGPKEKIKSSLRQHIYRRKIKKDFQSNSERARESSMEKCFSKIRKLFPI